MKSIKLLLAFTLVVSLTGCVGAVIGVAVDTTAAVIKAPFQLTGAVVGVAADTTGTVIAAPFRMVDAAVYRSAQPPPNPGRYQGPGPRGPPDPEHRNPPSERFHGSGGRPAPKRRPLSPPGCA